MEDQPKSYTIYQNPEIDILFGHVNYVIPSKKEDFKPIEVAAVFEDGTEEILRDFYQKKPSSKSVREFEEYIRKLITDTPYIEKKILKPSLVEVIVCLTLKKEKYFDIDVDNVAKTVLDSLTGYLFEDDSQVKRVVCEKNIHPLNMEGFFIAVTKLSETRRGAVGDLYLFSETDPKSKSPMPKS